MTMIPKLKALTVKALIEDLKGFPQDSRVLLSSDEELNTLYSDVQVATLSKQKKKTIVLWGNSGSEVESD